MIEDTDFWGRRVERVGLLRPRVLLRRLRPVPRQLPVRPPGPLRRVPRHDGRLPAGQLLALFPPRPPPYPPSVGPRRALRPGRARRPRRHSRRPHSRDVLVVSHPPPPVEAELPPVDGGRGRAGGHEGPAGQEPRARVGHLPEGVLGGLPRGVFASGQGPQICFERTRFNFV